MLWIRGNCFIPDARKFWIKPSVQYLSGVLEQEKIKTIITTGPPHSLHLIGLQLKKKLSLQWIADFRDPWTSIGYHKKLRLSKRAQKRHLNLERTVLQNADKIIVTSPTTQEEFATITTRTIKVITNGFDGVVDSSKVVLDEKFTISHIGSLLTGRNPQNLWKSLGELVKENSQFKEALQLQLVGVVSEDVLASIKEYHLEPYMNRVGYVNHEQALKYQQQSQVLLLVEIDSIETKGIIPGKLFEYLRAERPIMAFGPEGWDAGKIIEDTQAGEVFSYSLDTTIKEVLLNWFQEYKQKQLKTNAIHIEQYSRKALTKVLADYITWE